MGEVRELRLGSDWEDFECVHTRKRIMEEGSGQKRDCLRALKYSLKAVG